MSGDKMQNPTAAAEKTGPCLTAALLLCGMGQLLTQLLNQNMYQSLPHHSRVAMPPVSKSEPPATPSPPMFSVRHLSLPPTHLFRKHNPGMETCSLKIITENIVLAYDTTDFYCRFVFLPVCLFSSNNLLSESGNNSLLVNK